jgi:hypothetical protein
VELSVATPVPELSRFTVRGPGFPDVMMLLLERMLNVKFCVESEYPDFICIKAKVNTEIVI